MPITDLREASNRIARSLINDPQFRRKFLENPRATCLEAGVPEANLPDERSLAEIDAIGLGMALERAKNVRFRLGETPPVVPGSEIGEIGEITPVALAVACVVV